MCGYVQLWRCDAFHNINFLYDHFSQRRAHLGQVFQVRFAFTHTRNLRQKPQHHSIPSCARGCRSDTFFVFLIFFHPTDLTLTIQAVQRVALLYHIRSGNYVSIFNRAYVEMKRKIPGDVWLPMTKHT